MDTYWSWLEITKKSSARLFYSGAGNTPKVLREKKEDFKSVLLLSQLCYVENNSFRETQVQAGRG
jgi:hypothetical protein